MDHQACLRHLKDGKAAMGRDQEHWIPATAKREIMERTCASFDEQELLPKLRQKATASYPDQAWQKEEEMSASGIVAFDRTLQTTNMWLNDIMIDHGPDRQLAWHILGSVLQTLRDRIPADLSAHLSAQLPLLVRGVYYEHYDPSKKPQHTRTIDEFCEGIRKDFATQRPIDVEKAVQSVFRVLTHYLDPGEVAKVRSVLPPAIRELWPDPNVRH
jgi:uncharacterized protein (DUF2267 family)